MGEAILTKAGGSGGGCIFGDLETFNNIISNALTKTMYKNLINANSNFVAPSTGIYEIICIGGGGGGGGGYCYGPDSIYYNHCGAGGGSGYINYGYINLNQGDTIPITIGSGGAGSAFKSNAAGSTGGTTSFGSYLSAAGGTGGKAGVQSFVSVQGGAGYRYGNNSDIANATNNRDTSMYNQYIPRGLGACGFLPPDKMDMNIYGYGGDGGYHTGNGNSGGPGCVWVGRYG